MKPDELIANLRVFCPQNLTVIFQYLADRLYQAQLPNGTMLRDVSDVRDWLEHLSTVARAPLVKALQQNVCPRCGHIHNNEKECGEKIGGGRVCRCEMELAL
jgi:hypothetical protein